jgi:hypothetical protein
MAHPYDDYEGFRGSERERDREGWRRDRWGGGGAREDWRRVEPWRDREPWRSSERGGEGWRGDEWRDRESWRGRETWRGEERGRWGGEGFREEGHGRDAYAGPPGPRDARAARDTLEGGDLGWHGGVRGAEGGGGYGGGFFGTAYSLYAGRPEHVGEGRSGGAHEEQRMGRGPKGYKRSDERIHDEVCERIARSGINADEVEVKVEGGEVTLTGSVDRRDDKWHLETICESVFGVDEVHDHLRVGRYRDRDTIPTH